MEMAKRFKLRLSFSSFQLCRLKQSSSMPLNPQPAHRFSPVKPKSFEIGFTTATKLPATPNHPLLKSPQVSPKIKPIDAKWQGNASWFGVKSSESDLEEQAKPRYKSYNLSVSDSSDEREEWRVRLPKAEKKSKKKKKMKTKASARINTFAIDSGCFSAEDVDDREDTETESLISSSRSFDSSYDFGYALGSFRKMPINEERRIKNHFKVKGRKHSGPKKTPPEKVNPARASVFRRLTLPCTAEEGKVRQSFAVVKRSEDPCDDFKRSMLEMILENQMFEAEDLEQLLSCFLSLNSRHHHPAIVEAFAEIWDVMFC